MYVYMFCTSYRKYILLQITETFCCSGKFIQKLFANGQLLSEKARTAYLLDGNSKDGDHSRSWTYLLND